MTWFYLSYMFTVRKTDGHTTDKCLQVSTCQHSPTLLSKKQFFQSQKTRLGADVGLEVGGGARISHAKIYLL